MEQLIAYMQAAGIKGVQLAQMIGATPAHVSDMRKGRRKPSRNLAIRIARVTGGAVPVEAWE
jgi:plasmid maintenance system antidote protein VapI